MAGFIRRRARAVNVMKQHSGRGKVSLTKQYGLNPRVFMNKDDPNYRYNYGTTYTERQMKILNGEIDIFTIKANEIKFIIKKAEGIGDCETCKKAEELYELRTHKEEYRIDMSIEEARDVLQSLTPWEIKWNK